MQVRAIPLPPMCGGGGGGGWLVWAALGRPAPGTYVGHASPTAPLGKELSCRHSASPASSAPTAPAGVQEVVGGE